MANVRQQLDTCRDAALAAVDASNYSEAIKQANKALLILSTIPDSGVDKSTLTWNRDGISKFIAECRRQLAFLPASMGGSGASRAEAYAVEFIGARDRRC